MSLKILTLLNGLAGIGGMATVPSTQMVASSSQAKVFEITSRNDYKVSSHNFKHELIEKDGTINHNDTLGLNTFPIGFTQILVPGTSVTIPLDLMWNQADSLKDQAEENNWTSWGYTAAAMLAKGVGSNGVVRVEADIALSPIGLAPLITDLNLYSHGSEIDGDLVAKVITLGGNLVVEYRYTSDTVGDVLISQSNPIPPIATGVAMAFVGTMETSDFHY